MVSLQPVQQALSEGDKANARLLLRPILKESPSAQAWLLAAHASDSREAQIRCLRSALAIDPYFTAADRMLLRVEGARPDSALPDTLDARARELLEQKAAKAAQIRADAEIALATAEMRRATGQKFASPGSGKRGMRNGRRARRPRSPLATMGCISAIVLMISATALTMNMIGVINGVFGTVRGLTGGPTAVFEWQGTPLALVENAPMLLPASQREILGIDDDEDLNNGMDSTGYMEADEGGRDTDVLDEGYLHEYTFAGNSGGQVAIYVQFLSLGANRVSRNIALVRPDGSSGLGQCDNQRILQEDNNMALTCDIDQVGDWRVRLLGRRGESVGAYFFGVEPLEDF